jgi:hypothetical protein
MPIMDYGICVYGFTYVSHLERLVKLQKRAARIVCFSDSDYLVLFKELNWIPFIERRNYFSSIFIFKCLKKLSAFRCHSFFNLKENNRRTRSSTNNELMLPKSHLSGFLNSIFYSGVEIYNQLDVNLRKIDNFKTFVRNLKNNYN